MSVFDPARLPWELPASVWNNLLTLDVDAWEDVAGLETLDRVIQQTQGYGQDLVPETFFALYNDLATLNDVSPSGCEVLHALFKRAEQMPDWLALRKELCNDEVASAFGCSAFVSDFISRLPEQVVEEIKRAGAAKTHLDGLYLAKNAMETVLQEGAADSDLIAERLDQLDDAIAQAEEANANSIELALQTIDNNNSQIQNAIAKTSNATSQEVADIKEAAQSFGLSWGYGPGSPGQRQQIEGIDKLAAYLKESKTLMGVMDYLGWATRVVQQQKRQSQYGRETFTHYQTQEIDLENLAPQEMVGMFAESGSILHTDFMARLMEDDLLHMQYEGEDDSGKGPIIFVSDTSGTMRGRPNQIRVAIELAMMTHARKESRRFISIPFSGIGQFKVFDLGPAPDPQDLLRQLEFGYWGGTEPYKPLEEAFNIISTDPTMARGDICVLTDGVFAKPPISFLEKLADVRESPGVKIAALVIGRSPGSADFADKVVLTSDLVAEKDKFGEALRYMF